MLLLGCGIAEGRLLKGLEGHWAIPGRAETAADREVLDGRNEEKNIIMINNRNHLE